jgi:adenylate cyclase class IV
MQNVELKAELRDLPLARSICLAIGAIPITTLDQTDTYFKLPAGRLKRRETLGEPTQYIFYHRADLIRPRISTFTIYNESEAILLYAVHNLPEWVRVRKTRELFMLDHLRIHLDRVEGLGAFVEFESLITPNHAVRPAHDSLARVRRELLPTLGEPISCGYSDLIAAELSEASY